MNILSLVAFNVCGLARISALAGVSFLLASCGGISNLLGTSEGFQGTWSGTVSTTGISGASGSMTLNIDENNNVTGSDTLSNAPATSVDNGSISTTGQLTLQCSANGKVESISATLNDLTGELTGSGTLTVGSTSTPITILLTGGGNNLLAKPKK